MNKSEQIMLLLCFILQNMTPEEVVIMEYFKESSILLIIFQVMKIRTM